MNSYFSDLNINYLDRIVQQIQNETLKYAEENNFTPSQTTFALLLAPSTYGLGVEVGVTPLQSMNLALSSIGAIPYAAAQARTVMEDMKDHKSNLQDQKSTLINEAADYLGRAVYNIANHEGINPNVNEHIATQLRNFTKNYTTVDLFNPQEKNTTSGGSSFGSSINDSWLSGGAGLSDLIHGIWDKGKQLFQGLKLQTTPATLPMDAPNSIGINYDADRINDLSHQTGLPFHETFRKYFPGEQIKWLLSKFLGVSKYKSWSKSDNLIDFLWSNAQAVAHTGANALVMMDPLFNNGLSPEDIKNGNIPLGIKLKSIAGWLALFNMLGPLLDKTVKKGLELGWETVKLPYKGAKYLYKWNKERRRKNAENEQAERDKQNYASATAKSNASQALAEQLRRAQYSNTSIPQPVSNDMMAQLAQIQPSAEAPTNEASTIYQKQPYTGPRRTRKSKQQRKKKRTKKTRR